MSRKHNFVVGYEGEHQCVYSKETEGKFPWIIPLTYLQAKKMSKKIITKYPDKIIRSVVYKLVKVK